jgi:hypothetical protein
MTSFSFTIALHNWVINLDGRSCLGCSTRLVINNMDILLLYVPMSSVMFNIEDHMFNRNMENHPGKQFYHKTYGSVLAY